jgi:hypothetical protein
VDPTYVNEVTQSEFVAGTDAALGYGLRPQQAAAVRGMVLGDRSLIPEALDEAFQGSGITHVLLPS